MHTVVLGNQAEIDDDEHGIRQTETSSFSNEIAVVEPDALSRPTSNDVVETEERSLTQRRISDIEGQEKYLDNERDTHVQL